MVVKVLHSSSNSFEGWSSEDLARIDIEASIKQLNASIEANVQRLYPDAQIEGESDDRYTDTRARFDGEENEQGEEWVRDAVGRAYSQMDWVVYR